MDNFAINGTRTAGFKAASNIKMGDEMGDALGVGTSFLFSSCFEVSTLEKMTANQRVKRIEELDEENTLSFGDRFNETTEE